MITFSGGGALVWCCVSRPASNALRRSLNVAQATATTTAIGNAADSYAIPHCMCVRAHPIGYLFMWLHAVCCVSYTMDRINETTRACFSGTCTLILYDGSNDTDTCSSKNVSFLFLLFLLFHLYSFDDGGEKACVLHHVQLLHIYIYAAESEEKRMFCFFHIYMVFFIFWENRWKQCIRTKCLLLVRTENRGELESTQA